MITTLILTLLALLGGLSPALQLEPDGAPWRIVTCHFTHWTYEQLAWDVLALFALGVACERRNRAAFHATLLASVITIPLAVLAFAPEVTAYRGLSGIDSALFALLLVEGRRSRLPNRGQAGLPVLHIALAIAFIAKLAFELFTDDTLFVTNMGDGVSPVPVAHLAGALTALAIATLRKRAIARAPLGGSKIDGSRMTVEEHPSERHVYTRVTCESCSPCSWR